jgi:hypothetical protein
MFMSTTVLNLDEQATNFATMQHIQRVQHHLHVFVKELLDRGIAHDRSKLGHPEVEAFVKHTDALAGSDYGGQEYEDRKKEDLMRLALESHYANNRHHPEHFQNGIHDMTLVDIVEMFCDWKAASERHHTGNLRKSISHNAGRFHMSPQLVQIFENTVSLLEENV